MSDDVEKQPISPTTSVAPHPEAHLTIQGSLKSFLFKNPLNILLIFLPLGIIAQFVHWPAPAIFTLNFLAIIPLSKLLGTATEEISFRTGEVIGGLINATFGNAVELIISIIALQKGLIRVLQSSLLGSILSNLLLVMGFCFLFGGIKYSKQTFNLTSANTSASMLALAVLSILVPAAFDLVLFVGKEDSRTLALSRGTSIVTLIIYGLFLLFQLKTHRYLYEGSPKKDKGKEKENLKEAEAVVIDAPGASRLLKKEESVNKVDDVEEDEEEEPEMLFAVAIIALLVVTVFVAVCAEFLVGSIEDVSKQADISETFIGLILVPIVGNAAEHVTAVSVAMKNKMDLALSVAIGSSTQIALFVTPFMVILGWIMGQPMSLDFHAFETVVMFMAVLIVNYLIMDGSSNWLEGAMLLGSYLIIAIAFYLYPASLPTGPN